MFSEHHRYDRVVVRITGQIALGLVGQVDGARAIIRHREIAWQTPLPLSEYIGKTRKATIIGFNPLYQELELSLRLAERDPWEEVPLKYPEGSQVDGQVVGLAEDTAFVEIEPGVKGVLPKVEILPQPVESIQDLLWMGDHVKAKITRVDVLQRYLILSLKDLLIKREHQFHNELWAIPSATGSSNVSLADYLPKDMRSQLLKIGRTMEQPAEVLRVLVIEDDETYGAGLRGLLILNSCQVIWAKSGCAGLYEIQKQERPLDLILIDWGLPDLKGHELLRLLQKDGLSSRLAMVFEPAPLNEQREIWQELKESEADIFSKAEGDRCKEGIIALLRELRSNHQGTDRSRQRFLPRESALGIQAMAEASPTDIHAANLSIAPGNLATILERLGYDTGATTSMLLRLDSNQGRVRLEGYAGKKVNLEQAPPDLIYSPLKDILQDGKEVHETVPLDSINFRRLLNLTPFQGFWGAPIPGIESIHYGLILLKEQGAFDLSQRDQARMACYLVATILRERQFVRALQPWQAQNLAGHLVGGVIHEVNNKLGGIRPQIDMLLNRLQELLVFPDKSDDAAFLQEMEHAVQEIDKAAREAGRLRDGYLGLTVSDDPQSLDLALLAQEVVRFLRPEAQSHNIVLRVNAAANVPAVRARPSELRQVLLNLMLNAIQQMHQFGREGFLIVGIRVHPNSPRPIQVRITDDGPGIHTQLWERIFEFGYTSRKGGGGLGLTICKQITANLHGRLSVEKSHMLWGTTFLLELPKGDKDG